MSPVNSILHHVFWAFLLTLAVMTTPSAGPWRSAQGNTGGWQIMSPNERIEHQQRMRSFNDYEACKGYQAEHHIRVRERAERTGVILNKQLDSGCDQLRRKGKFR